MKIPTFFLIAGEASGDLLGAKLMHGLYEKLDGKVRFVGIGGERMKAEGLELFFPSTELAHVGLFEIISHLPRILRRIKETVAEAQKIQPDALITIDSPDFCFRVVSRLKKLGATFPLIHYVAPSVWAWRPGRAKKIAKFLDHLMALLPFEPPYFTAENLPCTFVGHPIVEGGAGSGRGARFRRERQIQPDAPLLAVLPGSRVSEVKRLLPVFAAAVVWLRSEWPKLQVVIPTLDPVAKIVKEAVKHWPVPVTIVETDEEKYDAMAASTAGLACSGTVSVEMALAGLPGVIAYKLHPLTYKLYRRFVKVKFATLLNIMHGRAVMPEFIQNDCKPEKLAAAVHRLLSDDEARKEQKAGMAMMAEWLGAGQFVPSERAAQVVLDIVSLRKEKC
jgi:lipid-A-disaccharide synthase